MEGFGLVEMWHSMGIPAKTVALFRKTRHRGVRRVGWMFTFALAVYNLVRLRNVIRAQAVA